jgi:hypothetical protein
MLDEIQRYGILECIVLIWNLRGLHLQINYQTIATFSEAQTISKCEPVYQIKSSVACGDNESSTLRLGGVESIQQGRSSKDCTSNPQFRKRVANYASLFKLLIHPPSFSEYMS